VLLRDVASAELRACELVDNSSAGLACIHRAKALVSGSTVCRNDHVGIVCQHDATALVERCVVQDNASVGLLVAQEAHVALVATSCVRNNATPLHGAGGGAADGGPHAPQEARLGGRFEGGQLHVEASARVELRGGCNYMKRDWPPTQGATEWAPEAKEASASRSSSIAEDATAQNGAGVSGGAGGVGEAGGEGGAIVAAMAGMGFGGPQRRRVAAGMGANSSSNESSPPLNVTTTTTEPQPPDGRAAITGPADVGPRGSEAARGEPKRMDVWHPGLELEVRA